MKKDTETVELKFEKIERNKKKDAELREGYVHFTVHIDTNGKKFAIEKRVRLDKPERMLGKLITKIKEIAEEKYKGERYYVANKEPPAIESVLVNEEEIKDKMLPVFDEIIKCAKTGNISLPGTGVVEF
jgi:hypothetical protein